MEIFIWILAIIGTFCIIVGLGILNNSKLEIGVLVGVYPLLWGLGIDALAAVLWSIQHLRFSIV